MKMGSVRGQIPHVVCLPFPAQGHVSPFMQLSKLLHSRGFHVTFVNTEFNQRRLVKSEVSGAFTSLSGFEFETIPDGLPPSDQDATQDVPSLFYSIRRTCHDPFKELVGKLNSRADRPPVTCVISDGIMSFGMKVAKELGIKQVTFWTASACGLMGYLQYSELVNRGIVPFKDDSFLIDGTLDTLIGWIPDMKNMRLKDLPSFARTTDVNDILFDYLRVESEECFNSSAIIVNTFDGFEHLALSTMQLKLANIFPIGPISLLARHIPDPNTIYKSLRSSLWKEDTTCLQWLQKWDPKSVLYVNYGSITVMSDRHLKEFAWGLANSNRPFLWIVRPDVVMGDSAILPEEFFSAVKDRGMLASWCPQDEVLGHGSVGAFLTHCGWNSMVESVCGGIPVICWPFFAEQQTNSRYACGGEWGIGMEMDEDVKRGEVEALVKEMMGGERGVELREKAKEWKRKALEATDVGGSSFQNLDRVIEEFLSV